MKKYVSNPRLTLAQSLIAQGLITNPAFVNAARVQALIMLQTGTYRLLGAILEELPEAQPHSSSKLPLVDLLLQPEALEPTSLINQANMLDLTALLEQSDLLDLSDLIEQSGLFPDKAVSQLSAN